MNFPLPSNDPLGTSILLDRNGDIVTTVTGAAQTVSGPDNVAQAIRIQMMTNAFTYLWGDQVGSILDGYVDAPITDQEESEIRNIVKEILNRDPRILLVQSVLIDDSTPNQLIVTPVALVEGLGVVTMPIKLGGK